MFSEYLFAYIVAVSILLIIPGPTALLIISYSISHGRKAALGIIAGVALGDLTAMTITMVGLGTLLSASATAFTLLKWVGALYLVYLGISIWRAPVMPAQAQAMPHKSTGKVFFHAYAVTALNPKSITFFVAFLPHFIDKRLAFGPQMLVLGIVYFILELSFVLGFWCLGALARKTISKPGIQRLVNRTGGAMVIMAGIAAVAWKGTRN